VRSSSYATLNASTVLRDIKQATLASEEATLFHFKAGIR
jgi:hypothetical protein